MYPLGPYIRVHAPVPWPLILPARLDPIGLCWYVRSGEYLTPLGCSGATIRIADGMGWPLDVVQTLLYVADRGVRLRAEDQVWRDVLETWIGGL